MLYYSLKFDDVISIQGRDEHVDEPQTNENSSRNVFRHWNIYIMLWSKMPQSGWKLKEKWFKIKSLIRPPC